MITYRHLYCVFMSLCSLLVLSSQAIELEFLTPRNKQILISGTNYGIKWSSRQSGTTNLTLMRMLSDTGIGSTIFEIASNVALSPGEYEWNIPSGLDINNVEFPPWAILSNCEGTQALSGAFWVNDVAIYKRDDGNSSDKTTRFPNGSSNLGFRTSSISTSVGGDSSTSTRAGKIEASTTTSGSSGISSSASISDISVSTMNSSTHTYPTLLATSTTRPSASEVKKNNMPMIVGIIVGVLGLFVLVTVFVVIRHRDKHGQPLTLPWKMRGDSNALELETTANLHEMEGPGKFELDGTGMKEKVYELEGRSIKKDVSIDAGG